MTEEERQKRLREMMSDAETHDQAALMRVKQHNSTEQQEENEYKARAKSPERRAEFIENMNKKLYASGEESIEDRLSKYKHYRQKGNTEYHSFLKRD